MKLIRVLMVVSHYPFPVVGGLENQSHLLSKALNDKNVDVKVLSSRFSEIHTNRDIVEGIPVIRIPYPEYKSLRYIITPFFLFYNLFKKRNTYDVIHIHQFSWFGLTTILFGKIFKKPTLTKLPNIGNRGIPGLKKGLFGALKIKILKKSDSIVAMSPISELELKDIGYPLSNVLLVPNGINIVNDNLKTKRKKNQHLRVVFVGRLTKEKCVVDLLHVWYRISNKYNHKVILEIWGDGPLKNELISISNELKLSGSVIFRGYQNNIKSKLASMDVFVLPSSVEGNSNAILEAMHSGLPIVASNVGGTPMQVGNHGKSMLFHPGDRDSMYGKLTALLENAELRTELGKKMRSRVVKHFDISNIADTYYKSYDLLYNKNNDKIRYACNSIINENNFSHS